MSDDNEVFYWQHSYSRVFTPELSYSPADGFMSFEHYNVEIRDRVKCISASEGCPSTHVCNHLQLASGLVVEYWTSNFHVIGSNVA